MKSQGRARNPRTAGGQSGHPMLMGVFIGVLVGLCLALGVALLLNRGPGPFAAKDAAKEKAANEKNGAKVATARPEPEKEHPTAQTGSPAGKPGEGKTRFDFYKILPGEEPVTSKELPQTAPQTNTSRVVYYLQAAAFQRSADADNLKARLALAGLEAQIQTATLPDNSVWHRVRLGPYTNAGDLEKAKRELKENNIESTAIKVSEPLAKR